jgi:hypothetical protein
MVWTTEPETINFRRGDHFFNRAESSSGTHAQFAGQSRRGRGMLRVWAVDAEHIRIANASPCLNMKSGDESAPNESYSQPVTSHR